MSVVRWAGATDVGRARKHNEDSYYGGERIFVVADGLGGHRAGEVASKIAVDRLAQLDRARVDDPATALSDAIRSANRAVYERASNDAATAGMATTVTAIALDDGLAHLAHVGDSRCYLLRDGQLTLVSTDHTLVARMVEEGTITTEQAETHPQRSIVTRALGSEPEVDIDTTEMQLARGDRILLCSDGLSSVVSDDRLHAVLGSGVAPDTTCRLLVEEANDRGGPDNITVIVMDVPEDAELPAGPVAKPSVAKPAPAPAAGPPKARARAGRRVPRRAVLWSTVAIVVLIASLIGVRAWADRSWFVGLEGQNVTIYRGLPTDFVISLKRVAERTSLSVADVAPHFRERLREGIRATDLEEARLIVERARATPSPSPTASSTASPSPTGTTR